MQPKIASYCRFSAGIYRLHRHQSLLMHVGGTVIPGKGSQKEETENLFFTVRLLRLKLQFYSMLWK